MDFLRVDGLRTDTNRYEDEGHLLRECVQIHIMVKFERNQVFAR